MVAAEGAEGRNRSREQRRPTQIWNRHGPRRVPLAMMKHKWLLPVCVIHV